MKQGADSILDDVQQVMKDAVDTGLFWKRGTVTVPPDVFDAGGAPDPVAPYVPLYGHENILCMDAPLQTGTSVTPSERKELPEVYAKTSRHILLAGYYPLILQSYRWLMDGVKYDITNVDNDSQDSQTRLAVQVVTV